MKSGNALWVAAICVASLVSFSSPAQVRITEFMAANTHTLADENGSFEDWIEVQNNSSTNVQHQSRLQGLEKNHRDKLVAVLRLDSGFRKHHKF